MSVERESSSPATKGSLVDPQPVVIVRPKRTTTENVASFIVGFGLFFLAGWFVMLLVPLVFPDLHPGYWQSVALCCLVRVICVGVPGYTRWTRAE